MRSRFVVGYQETTPGRDGLLCPPADWKGDDDDYHEWVYERYRMDIGFVQRFLQIVSWMRRGFDVRFEGPYAHAARNVVEIARRRNEQRAKAARASAGGSV